MIKGLLFSPLCPQPQSQGNVVSAPSDGTDLPRKHRVHAAGPVSSRPSPCRKTLPHAHSGHSKVTEATPSGSQQHRQGKSPNGSASLPLMTHYKHDFYKRVCPPSAASRTLKCYLSNYCLNVIYGNGTADTGAPLLAVFMSHPES